MGAGKVSGTLDNYGESGDRTSTGYKRARLGTVGNGLDLQSHGVIGFRCGSKGCPRFIVY